MTVKGKGALLGFFLLGNRLQMESSSRWKHREVGHTSGLPATLSLLTAGSAQFHGFPLMKDYKLSCQGRHQCVCNFTLKANAPANQLLRWVAFTFRLPIMPQFVLKTNVSKCKIPKNFWVKTTEIVANMLEKPAAATMVSGNSVSNWENTLTHHFLL